MIDPGTGLGGGADPPERPELTATGPADAPAPSEAFQRLASEVRVSALRALLDAERRGGTPLSFSALQSATPAETSAGFAYHLRQLDGHFVRATDDGYVLTPAGRAAARLVDDGTLTGGADRDQALTGDVDRDRAS